MKPFKIRDIEINPPLILSPMAGVTDYTFRRLIKRRGGVGLVVSEFISVEGLTRHNPKSKRQMRFDEEERPYAVQIFGGQAPRMAMGAEMAQDIGADILDVNCGCPAPKVVKNGGGSGLLRDLPRLEEILREIKKAITIPLTLKLRTGYSDASINVVDAAKLAEQCGVEHIQVHGRTREQGYKGLANWDLIRQVKEAVTIPVSGNGDITTIEYGMKRWRETGTDGILIGRGAMQNPWIFRQFADALAGREPYQPDLQQKKDVLLEFFTMCREEMPEIVSLGKMKQLAGQFTKGLIGGAQFRQTLYHSHSAAEILDNITIYFDTLESRETFGDGVIEAVADGDAEFDSCDAASGSRAYGKVGDCESVQEETYMKTIKTSALGFIAILILSFTASTQNLKVDEIVAKHLDAIGKREKRDELKTLMARGASGYESRLPIIKGGGKAVVVSNPENLFFVISLNSKEYPFEKIGFFNGQPSLPFINAGNRSLLGTFVAEHEKILSEGLFGGAMSLRWSFLNLEKRKPKMKTAGSKKVEGRKAYVLEYSPSSGGSSEFSIRLYFDAESFNHVRSEYRREVTRGQGTFGQANQQANAVLLLVEDFSDFRNIDGLTLPHTYKVDFSSNSNTSSNQYIWGIKVSDYYFNQKLAADFFTF